MRYLFGRERDEQRGRERERAKMPRVGIIYGSHKSLDVTFAKLPVI